MLDAAVVVEDRPGGTLVAIQRHPHAARVHEPDAARAFPLERQVRMAEDLQRLARVLAQAGRQISEAMPRLRNFDDMSHYTVEVNRLENEGDRIGREAVASLFEEGIDPLVVIRWKDIYERLEEAIDACEKVAYILEGITTKNA